MGIDGDRSSHGVAATGAPLLSFGQQARWAAINREEAAQLDASNAALSPAQRLAVGQRLSQQAVELLDAAIRAGHVPREALFF